jgi:urea transport system substrate-binding protein
MPSEPSEPSPSSQTVGLPNRESKPQDEKPANAGQHKIFGPPDAPGELGTLAHYRVLNQLGQGGMGAVFLAKDPQLDRTVALKVMLPEMAAEASARERFLREARAVAAIKNDHVITIYQVGQYNDVPFLAMELLQGRTLDEQLEKTPSLPLAEVLRIGREVAVGLAAAHQKALVHRDIKPANIWLETPTGRVKILDFGLARTAKTKSHLTETGLVIGTPDFMSPEQARGDAVDARSDLFSLGIVLYCLCTEEMPFQGKTVMAVLTALAVSTPKPVREINPKIPEPLADLIMRLLEKDPARRPATAEEVVDTIKAIEVEMLGRAETGQLSGVTLRARVRRTTAPAIAARSPWRWAALAVALVAIVAGITWIVDKNLRSKSNTAPPSLSGPPLRIGILHSRTGTMAISEKPVIDALLLAIEEVNQQGGVLGRPVEPVIADGQSDELVFTRQAEQLITRDKVATIFGCWTSASRKAVKPIVEKHDHLLYYPVQYEGLEQSPNIIYGGPVPNQQILPALKWMAGFENRKRWFLVGSDYVFPRAANSIIRDQVKSIGSEIVGEEYILLGSGEVGDVIKKIAEAKPDLIINTINGDTNLAFFRALRRAGITSERVPTLSFSVSEQELTGLAPSQIAGDYAAWGYFESIDLAQNRAFLQRFRAKYGADRIVSDPMQAAYMGVFLWSQAVLAAGTDDVRKIRAAFQGQRLETARGPVEVDPTNLHTLQTARVGRINKDGRFEDVYVSPKPVRPEPFPPSRTRAAWEEFLNDLHQQWGGRWANPKS